MLGLLRHGRGCYVLPSSLPRLLSTVGSTQQTRRTTAHPPPLNPRSRKHKLDIKPIKVEPPQTATRTATETTPPSPQKGKSKSSPIELAKQDVQSATAHGILVPPPADASWIRKLIHQGKELFKFYWNGLKLINSNRQLSKEIERRVRVKGIPMTRWETVFVRTNKQDLVKLIPFLLILLILEEALPLFVLYAPFLLPSTCLLVSQRNRIITQRATKQYNLVSSSSELLHRVAKAQGCNLKVICGIFSLSTFGPAPLLKRRLTSHLQHIRDDDALLLQEASNEPSHIPSNLSRDEILQVLADRGFVTTAADPSYAGQCLDWYFSQPLRTGDFNERLVLAAQAAIHSHQHQESKR